MTADLAAFAAAARSQALAVYAVIAQIRAERTAAELDDVVGADLHEGHIVVQALPDGTVERHTVDHFQEYPQMRTRDGRLVDGYHDGHARIVYGTDGWRHSCADTEPFHVQHEGEQS